MSGDQLGTVVEKRVGTCLPEEPGPVLRPSVQVGEPMPDVGDDSIDVEDGDGHRLRVSAALHR